MRACAVATRRVFYKPLSISHLVINHLPHLSLAALATLSPSPSLSFSCLLSIALETSLRRPRIFYATSQRRTSERPNSPSKALACMSFAPRCCCNRASASPRSTRADLTRPAGYHLFTHYNWCFVVAGARDCYNGLHARLLIATASA